MYHVRLPMHKQLCSVSSRVNFSAQYNLVAACRLVFGFINYETLANSQYPISNRLYPQTPPKRNLPSDPISFFLVLNFKHGLFQHQFYNFQNKKIIAFQNWELLDLINQLPLYSNLKTVQREMWMKADYYLSIPNSDLNKPTSSSSQ